MDMQYVFFCNVTCEFQYPYEILLKISRCKAPRGGGISITFLFLHFHRLWENEVGDPHILCARSVVNILMYYWQFF